MSLSLVHRICDQCDQEDDLVLMLPTGFQICEKHLRAEAEKKKKKNNLNEELDDVDLDCPFFSNTTNSASNQNTKVPFTIKKLKVEPINKLRLTIRELNWESNDLLSKIGKLTTSAVDLDEKIDKEFEDRLELPIRKRFENLTTKLNEYVQNLYKMQMDQLENVKRVYKSELNNSFSFCSIERDLSAYKQLIKNKSFYETDYDKTRENLEKKIDEIKKHREKLNMAEKCLIKKKYLEFKESNDEIKLNFGDLKFKSGELTCVDFKSISDQTTLERLFKLGDESYGKLPDLETIKLVDGVDFSGHFKRINVIEQMPNGEIVTASNDCTIKIWNRDGKCKKTLFGHQSAVKCFKLISYDKLVSASSSCNYDPIGGQSMFSVKNYQQKAHSSIIVWNLTNGAVEKKIQGPLATIYSIEILDNGLLVTGDSDGYLSLWDLESGNRSKSVKVDDNSIFSIIKLENRLVTGHEGGKIGIWNFDLIENKDHDFAKLSQHHSKDVRCLVKVDGTKILSGSNDGFIKFWDFNSKNPQSIDISEEIKRIKLVNFEEDKYEKKIKFLCYTDQGFKDVYEIDFKDPSNIEIKGLQKKTKNQDWFKDDKLLNSMEVTDFKEILVPVMNKNDERYVVRVFRETK